MKPIIIINTFKTVQFDDNKRPLIICDIDHTFLRPDREYDELYKIVMSDISNVNEIHTVVRQMFEACITHRIIRQTDQDGFKSMLEKVNLLGGKLVFLTARSSLFHKKTIQDLQKVGLDNPEQYEIHYTSNLITKGNYIQKNKLLENYDYHIFIDDFPHCLESALNIYPDMNCYLFKYN